MASHNLEKPKAIGRGNKRKADESTSDLHKSASDTNILLMEELKKIGHELTEVKNSMQFMSSKYDDLLAQLQTEAAENKTLREEVKELNAAYSDIQYKIETMELEQNKNKQDSIRNNAVLFGIPKLNPENNNKALKAIINTLLSKVNMKANDVLIDAFQINNRENQTAPIVIKFADNYAKTSFIKLVKRIDLIPKDLDLQSKNRIFITEQLTPINQKLLAEARQLRAHGFKFVWTKNGRILVRRTNDSEIMVIQNLHCIESLKSNNITI